MTVKSGVTVNNNGGYSSLFENGYYNYKKEQDGIEYPNLTINGGTFTGGINTIKNDDNATLTIKDGIFQNYTQSAFQNHHIARIEGGTFDGANVYAVLNCGVCSSAVTGHDNHETTITGGKFNGTISQTVGKITILGGTFSSDVSSYCAKNYAVENNGNNTYTVKPLKDVAVAQIEENGFYKTIEAAVNVAENGATITLLKDTTEDVTVPSEKNITLDLNGKKLTNVSNNTITIEKDAELTVTGNGTVDNTKHGKSAIYNKGTATLENGTFDRSKEAGKDAENNGGNSYYTVLNHGKMTVEPGVTVNNKGGYSSLFENGYFDYTKTQDGIANPELTINGGTFTGGLNTIKNDDNATLTIKDGIFQNYTQSAFQNHHIARIEGGTFDGANVYAVLNCGVCSSAVTGHDNHETTITGGKFNGTISKTLGNITISGGYFTSDPTKYLVEGKVAGSSDIDGYAYKVVEKNKNAKPAESEVTSVPVKTIEGADETTKEAAKEVKGVAVDQSSADIIDAATKDLANKNTIEVTNDTTVVDSLKTLTNDDTLTKNDITLVYQSYIDVTVKEAVKSGDTEGSKKFTELTVDLTPMYRVVATKNDNVTYDKDIIIEGEASEGKTANAVVVNNAEKLDLKNVSYNVSLVLPSGFAENNAKLSIKHVKDNGSDEYYTGTVENHSGILIVNFTTNGFSPFTVYAESVASIDDTLYPTLQTAVDAVKDGQTITVTKDTDSASVSGDKSFTIVKGTNVSKVTLTAASGYNLTIDGNKYTVSPRHSSSGSSTTTYTVTVGSVSNGTVTSSHKSAASGATVTLTVKPADGYAVEAVAAKDAKGNAVKVTEKDGKYTFVMPASNVTVSASFVKKGEQPAAKLFDDVAQGAYYYDAVKWAVDKGVTNGKTSNLFGSDDPCTRAQIVTFLWRAAGSPAASASVSFTDVKDSDYYAKATAWAVEKGITNGTGDGKFSPDDTCTRAQCAAFLYRAAGSPEVTDAAAFSDVAADAYYAKAVAWAEKNGITNGLGNGKFGSDNSCTRAQIITFLYRTYQGK